MTTRDFEPTDQPIDEPTDSARDERTDERTDEFTDGTRDDSARTTDDVRTTDDMRTTDDVRTTDDAGMTGTPTTDAGTDMTQEALVPQAEAVDLKARWEVIQQGFVDDPRHAVTDADSLVDEVLAKLSASFDEQQRELESQWSDGEPSTEDLRGALQRYRAFFERLLTI